MNTNGVLIILVKEVRWVLFKRTYINIKKILLEKRVEIKQRKDFKDQFISNFILILIIFF